MRTVLDDNGVGVHVGMKEKGVGKIFFIILQSFMLKKNYKQDWVYKTRQFE